MREYLGLPLFNAVCTSCFNSADRYLHHEFNREKLPTCHECDGILSFKASFGMGLTYFEEGRARLIHNLADEPVLVRSHWEHQQLMKKYGVAEAGTRRGMPGCWS
jgi:hypothetical protein